VERFRSPAPEAPTGQWAEEVVIAVPRPFEPLVSDPEALAAAEGMGRIEWADLVQFARGGYNGLISAAQGIGRAAVRQGVDQASGPLVAPLLSPYAERPIGQLDTYRLSIDPRHGGAGIMGEQLLENLVFEALPLVPQLGNIARRAVRSDYFLAPSFWYFGAGGAGGSSSLARVLRAAEEAPSFGTRLRILGPEYEAQKAVAGDILLEAAIERENFCA